MAKKQSMTLDEALQVILATDGDNPLRQMLEFMVQCALEHEMAEHLGAQAYERTDERLGYRNGHKPRVFTTAVGDLTLLVPQDRNGTFSTTLFERYQRSDKALALSLMEMYVQGVSTRKVASITETLCGRSFSSQQVSKLAAELDEKLQAWRSRRLDDDCYPYLFVDAMYERVRENARVVSKGVLVVMGVNLSGKREILAVKIADTENATTWSDTFRDLKARGLTGVLMVTSDDHEGIKAAVNRYFQGTSWQRCQFHFMQNILPLSPKGQRKRLRSALRAIFDSDDMETALAHVRETVAFYSEKRPKIAERIEEGIEDCLACLHFPPAHRKRIRTTNAVERLNEELRRRTRVVRIFPSEESALRLVTALAVEQSEEWETSSRRYLDLDKLEDWVCEHNTHLPWQQTDARPWPFDEPVEPAPGEEPARV
ncbi:MAG: IS256 family transposase [Actinomycetia bacterium]|nr:IS256 family transposase [Actinomycetes bacterium]